MIIYIIYGSGILKGCHSCETICLKYPPMKQLSSNDTNSKVPYIVFNKVCDLCRSEIRDSYNLGTLSASIGRGHIHVVHGGCRKMYDFYLDRFLFM